MDCNKDEALRSKLVAENKMKNCDFQGAKKIALKARTLFPELENINQMLSVCDVHCSAQKTRTGSEKDWYGILQVDKFADDLTVKRQYRRLALFLHPDKNQLPGAEAAFKLICEANAVLSDPLKKSQYNAKIGMSVRYAPVNPPPHHINKNSQFSYNYRSMPPRSSTNIRLEMFWTICPYCSLKYQHDRQFLYTKLVCQRCSKNFTACEIDSPACTLHMPPNPGGTQYAAKQQDDVNSKKKVPRRGTFSGVHLAQDGTKVPYDKFNSSHGVKKTRKRDGDAVNCKQKGMKATIRRRAKIYVVDSESSVSDELSSDSDLENTDASIGQDSGSSHAHYPRRSSRKRKTISYDEDNGDDSNDEDDFTISPKRSQGRKLSADEVDVAKDAQTSEDFKSDHDEEFKARVESSFVVCDDATADQNSTNPDLGKNVFHAADPEFSNFDKDREEESFAGDQYWACYDDLDGMPRFYAKVDKVCRIPFKLSFTWLEFDPIDESQRNWVQCNFPVSCGSFKLGNSDTTSARATFSHRVTFHRGKKRGSLVLLPRKGEIWAIFRDWNICLSRDPENNRDYKYELVEVIDSVLDLGIRVCYLCKVEGFVSLFKRSNEDWFVINPKDLYRFSHEIPNYKMTGSEREGVPKGCFELDPASLPCDYNDLFNPSEQNVEDYDVHSVKGNMSFNDCKIAD